MKISYFNRTMKTISLTFATLAVFTSIEANASVTCPATTLAAIQPDASRVYVWLDDQGFKSLGEYTDPSTKAKLATAMMAMATNRLVQLRFPDGTDCYANSETPAIMIKVSGS